MTISPTLQSRQLMTPAQKGLTSGLSIAATLLLLLLGFWAYRRYLTKQAALRAAAASAEANEKSIEVELREEETSEESHEEEEDLEIAESTSSDTYDKSISMCRSGTMTSLDVHTCASGSCDTCRRQQEPSFVGVKKLEPGTEGRIRSLPGRWWENPHGYLQQEPQMMQTIVSMSQSEEGSWDDTIREEDETTLGDSTFQRQLDDGVVRD